MKFPPTPANENEKIPPVKLHASHFKGDNLVHAPAWWGSRNVRRREREKKNNIFRSEAKHVSTKFKREVFLFATSAAARIDKCEVGKFYIYIYLVLPTRLTRNRMEDGEGKRMALQRTYKRVLCAHANREMPLGEPLCFFTWPILKHSQNQWHIVEHSAFRQYMMRMWMNEQGGSTAHTEQNSARMSLLISDRCLFNFESRDNFCTPRREWQTEVVYTWSFSTRLSVTSCMALGGIVRLPRIRPFTHGGCQQIGNIPNWRAQGMRKHPLA